MRGDVDKTGLVLFVLTLAAVVTVGVLVMDGMAGDWDDTMGEMCQDEYGDGWTANLNGEVLMCENEAGQTAEFPMEDNSDQDPFAVWKIAGVIAIVVAVVVQFNSFLQRFRDE